MNSVKLAVNNQTVCAEFDNSRTTMEFLSHLPLTLDMARFDEREYCAVLPFTPPCDGEWIDDFHNGDITYFPALNTLAIFYAREGESTQAGLIRIGRITSGQGVFASLGGNAEVTLRLQ